METQTGMKISLKKKPKNPIIIEGFPGFGLVATIATEFIIEQLGAKMIGKIKSWDLPAMVAIHEGELVQPIGIFYDEKTNIVILHAVIPPSGIEGELSEMLIELFKELKTKEIVSLEGVSSPVPTGTSNVFYYTNQQQKKKQFEKMKIQQLKEGIILGVTGSLLIEAENIPLTCLFAETASSMPDSKAAAKIIQVLDKYLDLDIDYAPLLKQAEKFESKIKNILEHSASVTEEQKKKLSYVG